MAGNEMLDQMNQLLKRAEPNAPMTDDDKEFFNSIYDSIIKSLRMEPGAAVSESDIIDSLKSLDQGSSVGESGMQGYTMLEEILRNIYKTRSGIDSET
tara:strand:- start:2833 stop:3126 length:294 start_codon:yes stop_codon:yes gene_type:complete